MRIKDAREKAEALRLRLQDCKVKSDLRSRVAAACFGVAQQHHTAILMLVGSQPPLHATAFALLRLLVEATFRGHWASHCADNRELENLLTGDKRQWDAARMIAAVGRAAEAAGSTAAWQTFYQKHWKPMSAFAHTYEDQLRCWLLTDDVKPTYSADAIAQLLKRAHLMAEFSAAGLKALSESEVG
jgi:hypothetical protein